jgi:anti-sigma28 factor (negative regulator of flagellin synthesis)
MDSNISDTGPVKGPNYYRNSQKKPFKQEVDDSARTDEVEISDEVKERRKVDEWVSLLKQMPSVREDKVEEVRENLEKGRYEQSSVMREVAENIEGEWSITD